MISDQILVPTATGYKAYPLLLLIGARHSQAGAVEGFGSAQARFITQRGPFQDGESVIDMRFETRTSQIAISDSLLGPRQLAERKEQLFDKLRPNRSFGDGRVEPLIYRRWVDNCVTQHGNDLSVENGDNVVYSASGRFVDLRANGSGDLITIAGVTYTIASVPNDFSLVLTANYAGATAEYVAWSISHGGRAYRDLYFLVEDGPQFDMNTPRVVDGYAEVIRMVSHDPFWYGAEQHQDWAISDSLGDLVFDGEGAWFGRTPGTGRWLFSSTAVGETVDIVYFGTYRARPSILVTGPAVNPSVQNITTGSEIQLEYSIPAGMLATINTLTLVSELSDGTPLDNYLTGDLTTFGIEPERVASGGVNQIQVGFSGGVAGQSLARISWRNAYTGI